MITLDALRGMDNAALAEVVRSAHPIPAGALDDTQYLGIDLSLPALVHRVLWTTFRKTFHRDTASGVLRGWNVRLEQTGIEGPKRPMRDRKGRVLTFGHYHLRSAEGVRFPGGWRGADYLDYGVASNHPWDLARFGYCPIVAVNAGSAELLLGWEVFRVGGVFLPLPDYWVLVREGALDEVVPPPRAR